MKEAAKHVAGFVAGLAAITIAVAAVVLLGYGAYWLLRVLPT